TAMLPITWLLPPLDKLDSWQETRIGALSTWGKDPIQQPVICGRGSDYLTLQLIAVRVQRFPNLPSYRREIQPPEWYVDEIVEAFTRAEQLLIRCRERMLAPSDRLDRHVHALVRVIPRPTMEYMLLLRRSLTFDSLRSLTGRRNRIVADLTLLNRDRLDSIDQLKDAEVESLLECDIPRFEVPANLSSIGSASLTGSPIQASRTRLSALDEFDI